jgi:hypothetical protein
MNFAAEKKQQSKEIPQPFGLVLGKSTKAEAEAVWLAEGGVIISKGHGEAKPGYGVDNDPEGVANDRVEIIDVAKLPLDRLKTARFGFLDGKLYLVRYEFDPGADFDKIVQQVISKYGRPKQSSDFGDKLLVWGFGGMSLVLKDDFMEPDSMLFRDEMLMKRVKASHAEVYAQHVKQKAKQQKGF